jgi:ribosome-associated toxin RatA of RatAB toxin-antitoxin module
MRSVSAITIDGDLMTVYRLGAEIEKWPDLLPHYRDVELLWEEDDRRRVVAKMAASRDGIPVSWTCWQERIPDEPRITFRHIDGFTRGMQVAWTFEQTTDRLVTVRIIHEFRKGWPIQALDRFITEKVVGQFFVHAIAGQTLAQVKLLAEADRESHEGLRPLASLRVTTG